MTEINLKLVIALVRGYNTVITEIEKNIQGYGLNISEFGVLEMLHHKGAQPVQKIAEKILVTSGTITYVIDKLQKKDLVYRKKCKQDKRVCYICLTEKGEVLIEDIFLKHKNFLDKLFGNLSDEAKKEIVKNLVDLQESVLQ